MQSREYLEQKRETLKKDLETTLATAREHASKEEQEIREKSAALTDYIKQSQRRVSHLEGAIMGLNDALSDPEEKEKV